MLMGFEPVMLTRKALGHILEMWTALKTVEWANSVLGIMRKGTENKAASILMPLDRSLVAFGILHIVLGPPSLLVGGEIAIHKIILGWRK